MRRTRHSSETSACEGDNAGDDHALAKRPCTVAETWTVKTGGCVGGSVDVDYEHFDFQAHGVHTETCGLAGKSEEDFVINAKAIDAGNDTCLSPEARAFYAGTDLRLTLWTVRQGWGVFGGHAPTPSVDEVEVEVEVGDEGAMAADPPTRPEHREDEWLRRRDFVQILGFDSPHLGGVRWIELPPPDDIEDDEVHSLASGHGGEDPADGAAFRHYHNHLWTTRVCQAAAASVRTLYVASRLASMGVSLSADGEVTFGPGVLGESFQLLASGRSVVAPPEVFAHFAQQSQFIYTVSSRWKEVGLAVPMAPFPFGSEGVRSNGAGGGSGGCSFRTSKFSDIFPAIRSDPGF
jgi:hypothetical protein